MAILLIAILALIAFHTFTVLGTDPRDAGEVPSRIMPAINSILLIAALEINDRSLLAPILFSLSLSSLLTPAIFSAFKTFSPFEKASDFALIALVKMVGLTILAIPLVLFKSGWWVIVLGVIGGVLFLSRFGIWIISGGSGPRYIFAVVGLVFCITPLSIKADMVGLSARNWFKTLSHAKKAMAEQDGSDQPATAPESKSEDEENPQSESEGRSQ